jgi:hypothetical protein
MYFFMASLETWPTTLPKIDVFPIDPLNLNLPSDFENVFLSLIALYATVDDKKMRTLHYIENAF